MISFSYILFIRCLRNRDIVKLQVLKITETKNDINTDFLNK